MATQVTSARYPSVLSSKPVPLKTTELFPQEMIDVLGGEEALMHLKNIPEAARPDYGVHLSYYLPAAELDQLVGPGESTLLKGLDQNGRPFFLIHCKGHPNLICYPYTHCTEAVHFSKPHNWSIALLSGTSLNLGEPQRWKRLLELLEKVSKEEDCTKARDEVLKW